MMNPLKHLLADSYGKKQLWKGVKTALSVESCAHIILELFPKLTGRIEIQALQNGILRIAAQGPYEMQELAMQKRKIIEALCGHGQNIRDITVYRAHMENNEMLPELDETADDLVE